MERANEGVEVLRLRAPGRVQRTTNIYLLEGDGGVVVYETGSVGAADAIRQAAEQRGGISRIVLSHAHADHRGGASRLEAPIFCHPTSGRVLRATAGRRTALTSRRSEIRSCGP